MSRFLALWHIITTSNPLVAPPLGIGWKTINHSCTFFFFRISAALPPPPSPHLALRRSFSSVHQPGTKKIKTKIHSQEADGVLKDQYVFSLHPSTPSSGDSRTRRPGEFALLVTAFWPRKEQACEIFAQAPQIKFQTRGEGIPLPSSVRKSFGPNRQANEFAPPFSQDAPKSNLEMGGEWEGRTLWA